MSGRMLKRALKEQQAHPSNESIEENGLAQSEDEEENHVEKPIRNMFDLLGAQEDEADEAHEEEGEEVDTTREAESSKSSTSAATPTKGKKKKNKGKKKGKPSGMATSESTPALKEQSVDELLEKLAIANGETASTSDTPSRPVVNISEILAVDPRYLRAEDELRRIFGSKVINAVERSGEGGGLMSGRRRQPPRRGSRVLSKKTLLVSPLEHWPRPEGGLSMECTDTKDGLHFFRYVFSNSYMETQKRYEECVASHDPENIHMLVIQHPYHVDSLLALAEYFKHMGEFQRSADFLERGLYALECAWHPWFNTSTGTSRVDFSWEPNRPLFYALFKHMQHLGRRGCHRTALEVCKLLLSLDSDDPMGSLFCIDYFALRAEQYEWLQRFVREYGKERSLALLPSFSLSLALAQFHLEAKRSDPSSASKSATGKTSPESESFVEEEDSSLDLLQQALMLHPSVLKKIVDKAPIKEDAAWAKLLKHNHFSRATAGGPSLEHLINIYIERNYLVWRAADVQSWLKKGAQFVIDAADNAGALKNGGEIANWACVRKEAFSSDTNEYRHLMVSQFSDSTSTLPPEEVQPFGLPVGLGAGAAPLEGMPDVAAQEMELEGRSALLVFLQSLMPWLDYGADLHGQDPPTRGGELQAELDMDLVGESQEIDLDLVGESEGDADDWFDDDQSNA